MLPKILEADIILMSNEISAETICYVTQEAHRAGKTVVFNPAPVSKTVLQVMKNITYLTPNAHEAALLFPGEEPDSLPEKYQGELIVTLGADGAAAWDGKTLKISARKAKVADTTGAGDTFNGALCYGLSCECTLEKALRYANTAAGLSTEGFGAQGGMPALEDVRRCLEGRK